MAKKQMAKKQMAKKHHSWKVLSGLVAVSALAIVTPLSVVSCSASPAKNNSTNTDQPSATSNGLYNPYGSAGYQNYYNTSASQWPSSATLTPNSTYSFEQLCNDLTIWYETVGSINNNSTVPAYPYTLGLSNTIWSMVPLLVTQNGGLSTVSNQTWSANNNGHVYAQQGHSLNPFAMEQITMLFNGLNYYFNNPTTNLTNANYTATDASIVLSPYLTNYVSLNTIFNSLNSNTKNNYTYQYIPLMVLISRFVQFSTNAVDANSGLTAINYAYFYMNKISNINSNSISSSKNGVILNDLTFADTYPVTYIPNSLTQNAWILNFENITRNIFLTQFSNSNSITITQMLMTAYLKNNNSLELTTNVNQSIITSYTLNFQQSNLFMLLDSSYFIQQSINNTNQTIITKKPCVINFLYNYSTPTSQANMKSFFSDIIIMGVSAYNKLDYFSNYTSLKSIEWSSYDAYLTNKGVENQQFNQTFLQTLYNKINPNTTQNNPVSLMTINTYQSNNIWAPGTPSTATLYIAKGELPTSSTNSTPHVFYYLTFQKNGVLPNYTSSN